MERLCGILLPLVHSKLHPYKNLTNNILLLERFNHLIFVYPTLADTGQKKENQVNFLHPMILLFNIDFELN